jgi:3-oxoacyl-[acyl-carrier protein] reductase
MGVRRVGMNRIEGAGYACASGFNYGASKGIGRAVADRVARAGNVPIGLARTVPADFPGEFVAVDLSDVAATAATLDSVVAGGRADAVVNNFGYSLWGALGEIDLGDLLPTYDLNVRVAVQVARAALPGMLAGSWGRIVNVTSLVTLGTARRTPYAALRADGGGSVAA